MRQVQENHTATQRPTSCYEKSFASRTPDPLCVGPFTTDMFSSPCGMWLWFTSPSVSSFSFISCISFSLSESSTWITTVSSI